MYVFESVLENRLLLTRAVFTQATHQESFALA